MQQGMLKLSSSFGFFPPLLSVSYSSLVVEKLLKNADYIQIEGPNTSSSQYQNTLLQVLCYCSFLNYTDIQIDDQHILELDKSKRIKQTGEELKCFFIGKSSCANLQEQKRTFESYETTKVDEIEDKICIYVMEHLPVVVMLSY